MGIKERGEEENLKGGGQVPGARGKVDRAELEAGEEAIADARVREESKFTVFGNILTLEREMRSIEVEVKGNMQICHRRERKNPGISLSGTYFPWNETNRLAI